ncbi:hypothetical protein BDP27DRAFT_1440654 [Rhodocollybia butyracea]|uniref:Uncharacterized protein n=1 Tax=Rhodocollybia butyracea TaxID=206335 RepID=A0A9P5P3X1_9AGAR|nr:hypothetical protein BDP27DRAFT_1440654 [Rhodocollybia butyracea]
MDKHDLKDIQQSYENGKERADMQQKNFDRISKFLTDNVAILVEAQRQSQNKVNCPSYIVNIRIRNQCWFFPTGGIPQQLLGSNTMNIFLDEGSILGTLCFQQKQNQKRFVVTLGFRNKTAWSDVHFLRDTEYEETTKDIYKRIGKGGYGSTLFPKDILWPEKPSPAGDWVLAAKVNSHMFGKSDNQYQSEIEVSKWWENPETSIGLHTETFCQNSFIAFLLVLAH